MDRVNILVVDSNRLFREGLSRILDGTRFAIAAEAPSLAAGIEIIEGGARPDLILLDVADASEQNYAKVKWIRAALPNARIVILTNRFSPRSLAESLEAGADGYLLKNMSSDALTHSLDLVLLGEKVFPTELAELLIEGTAGAARMGWRTTPHPSGMSEREVAILRCLAQGHPNRIIASRLQITEASVKVHLKIILRKIQVSNRTQAAIWAISNGLNADS